MKRFLIPLISLGMVGTAGAADLNDDVPVDTEVPVAEDGISIFGLKIGRGGRPDRYVPAITNPLFNETPFITSEVNPLFIYNNIPDSFPNVAGVAGGGEIIAGAAQARLALTDRIGFIASGDGYADANFNGLPDESGFINITAGLKASIIQNLDKSQAVTVGLRYQIPIQELSTLGIEFQAAGSGFFNPFITAATDLSDFGLEQLQVQGSAGFNLAVDQDAETSIFHFSLAANYELFENFYPVFEVNGFVPIEDGNRFTAAPLNNLNGVDLVNFGSSDRDTSVTVAGGARYRFTENAIAGLAVEGQVTDRTASIFGWRVTADLVLHF